MGYDEQLTQMFFRNKTPVGAHLSKVGRKR